MLEKIKSLFGGDSTAKINKRLSQKLHNMHFIYINEKFPDGSEKIIGRDGHINVEDGEVLCATVGIKTLFKLSIPEMKIWEFMSLNGCVIDFTDLDTGERRNVSVYYDRRLEKV